MPVPTNCIAAIAATAINAAISAYSMAVTPDPSDQLQKERAQPCHPLRSWISRAEFAKQTLRSS
jgi:hypothetical protein